MIQFISEHWVELGGGLLLILGLVAKFTKTKKDDEVHGVLSKLWQSVQKGADKIPPKTS